MSFNLIDVFQIVYSSDTDCTFVRKKTEVEVTVLFGNRKSFFERIKWIQDRHSKYPSLLVVH